MSDRMLYAFRVTELWCSHIYSFNACDSSASTLYGCHLSTCVLELQYFI